MGKHLILVGGGHAHLMTLANIHRLVQRGHRVTVIGPADFHYYSGMGPGMLGLFYKPEEIRFATRRLVENQGGTFIRAKVGRIDPGNKTLYTEDGGRFRYDVASFNSGSHIPSGIVDRRDAMVCPVKPIAGLLEARDILNGLIRHRPITVAVVGAGPAAVEVAGNAHQFLARNGSHGFCIHIFSKGILLERLPPDVRRSAAQSLRAREIQIHERRQVTHIRKRYLEFKIGETFRADFIFLATGVQPSAMFAAAGLPVGPDGGLAVNRFLQSTACPDIFGGGDCIHFQPQPLEKVGVYAVRQNPILLHNLLAALEGTALRTFSPGGAFLLILNLGDGTGLLHKWSFLIKGRLAFRIKDAIDRRFMRRFKAGENRTAGRGS